MALWVATGKLACCLAPVLGLPESMGPAACTGYEVGTMMLIYTMALAYGVASPIILPLALIYFIVQLCAPYGTG